jgi:hypothetical protein
MGKYIAQQTKWGLNQNQKVRKDYQKIQQKR